MIDPTAATISTDIDLVLKSIFALLGGYFFYRLRNIEAKADSSLSREQVKEMIIDSLKPYDVLNGEYKEDLKRIENKLDMLLTKIVGRK